MPSAVLLFSSNEAANQLVAGVPAAVRAALTLEERGTIAGDARVLIAVPGGWMPSDWAKAERARLLPNLALESDNHAAANLPTHAPVFDAIAVLQGDGGGVTQKAATQTLTASRGKSAGEAAILHQIGGKLLAATGKPSDGFVSRYLNRPISRTISRVLLYIPGITPLHATGLAALTALFMAAALLFGGANGLIAGALLFHAASVIDGVDGEIARVTRRSSEFGAKLDTIIDGITNLAFLSLASLNLWLQGEVEAATYGAVGLGLLATGLTALGLRSIAMGGPFTFDAVKNNFNARPSRIKNTLAAITSRDVYALVFAATFAFGFAEWMLLIFAVAAGIWLITISTVLFQTRARQS